MKAKVIIERGTDGTYDANMEYLRSVPFGLLGQGKTVYEAIDDFYNSYNELIAMYKADGQECPSLEFDFKYDKIERHIHTFGKKILSVSSL